MRFDTSETTKREWNEKRIVNSASLQMQAEVELNHTGGTYSQTNFRAEICLKTADLHSRHSALDQRISHRNINWRTECNTLISVARHDGEPNHQQKKLQ